MAYSNITQKAFAASRVRSQSDSDLTNPSSDSNGIYPVSGLKRNTSMDDLESRDKRKNFLYRLVRPWKWGTTLRRKSKNRLSGEARNSKLEASNHLICVHLVTARSETIP